MAEVIIAAGSNLGRRIHFLQQAGKYLTEISSTPIRKSSVWESEPVGPSAEHPFLNSVALIETVVDPVELLLKLKKFEQKIGRKKNPQRWTPRLLDLDIIAYDNLVIHRDNLIIPHPEYHRRLFVLLPLQEIVPGWIDPQHEYTIDTMIEHAPDIMIQKLNSAW